MYKIINNVDTNSKESFNFSDTLDKMMNGITESIFNGTVDYSNKSNEKIKPVFNRGLIKTTDDYKKIFSHSIYGTRTCDEYDDSDEYETDDEFCDDDYSGAFIGKPIPGVYGMIYDDSDEYENDDDDYSGAFIGKPIPGVYGMIYDDSDEYEIDDYSGAFIGKPISGVYGMTYDEYSEYYDFKLQRNEIRRDIHKLKNIIYKKTSNKNRHKYNKDRRLNNSSYKNDEDIYEEYTCKLWRKHKQYEYTKSYYENEYNYTRCKHRRNDLLLKLLELY